MKTATAVRAGTADAAQPKPPLRRLPKWLTSKQLEAVARSRCLLLLSVLSGESSVSTAVAAAKISRATYYQLETRALRAMLVALNPRAESGTETALKKRITRLEVQLQRLEQEKRRTQRLLRLSRQSNHAPLTRGRRGPWPKRPTPSRPLSPGASSP